jgi:cytochrome c oxidase subunit 3
MSSVSLELPDENRALKEKTSKWLLWLAIVTIVMFFAAFTSYYIVRRGAGQWLLFELPQMFWVSTAIILISSVTMNWAISSARKNNFSQARNGLLLTFILGIAFGICQYFGWTYLYSQSIVFAGPASNAAGSLLYLITALHLVHVFAGLIFVLVVMTRAGKGAYTSGNMLGIKLCAIYWHFLDALWIYLFLFLLFIR